LDQRLVAISYGPALRHVPHWGALFPGSFICLFVAEGMSLSQIRSEMRRTALADEVLPVESLHHLGALPRAAVGLDAVHHD
jgi:hypothetical protein